MHMLTIKQTEESFEESKENISNIFICTRTTWQNLRSHALENAKI